MCSPFGVLARESYGSLWEWGGVRPPTSKLHIDMFYLQKPLADGRTEPHVWRDGLDMTKPRTSGAGRLALHHRGGALGPARASELTNAEDAGEQMC